MLAAAKTSGSTPWRICAASVSEPANEYSISASGNCSAYSSKAGCERGGAEDDQGRWRRRRSSLVSRRRRSRRAEQQRASRRRAPGPRRRGSRAAATITDVALTKAVASTPSARPSSSTESRVIAAVIRCGPASISTSAITPSLSTETTVPVKRLRGESASCRSGAARARARRRSTSATGTRRRFDASRVVSSLPSASQRRSVSTETPSCLAASPRLRSGSGICLSIA